METINRLYLYRIQHMSNQSLISEDLMNQLINKISYDLDEKLQKIYDNVKSNSLEFDIHNS